jgi:hypothetical protein
MFDKKYVILSYSEINNINFNTVLETASNTARRSVDGSLTVIKYEGVMPSSVDALTTKSREYTYDEILAILAGPEWTAPMEEI